MFLGQFISPLVAQPVGQALGLGALFMISGMLLLIVAWTFVTGRKAILTFTQPEHFRFFPKVNRMVSHMKWLRNVEEVREDFLNSVVHFREKLGTILLQMRDDSAPKFFDRVRGFIENWPDGIPLAVEFRHTDWFNDPKVADELYSLLEENHVTNIIVDTSSRRDLLHMRLTNDEAFIRYVGANHPSDYTRLNDWIERLTSWTGQGLRNIHFFVHQNKERVSPLLAAHFIKKLNQEIGPDLTIYGSPEDVQTELF